MPKFNRFTRFMELTADVIQVAERGLAAADHAVQLADTLFGGVFRHGPNPAPTPVVPTRNAPTLTGLLPAAAARLHRAPFSWRSSTEADLVVTVNGHPVDLRMTELGRQLVHFRTPFVPLSHFPGGEGDLMRRHTQVNLAGGPSSWETHDTPAGTVADCRGYLPLAGLTDEQLAKELFHLTKEFVDTVYV